MRKPEEIRLSRYFVNYPNQDVSMSTCSLRVKSGIALTLGFVPFAVANIALLFFKGCAAVGDLLNKWSDKLSHKALLIVKVVLKIIAFAFAIPGVFLAGIMLGSLKLFSLSQRLVWGDFVEKPVGDGINVRAAQYGFGNLPWLDFQTIATTFFLPDSYLLAGDWKLKQWKKVWI